MIALLAVAGMTGLLLSIRGSINTVDVVVLYLITVVGIALLSDIKGSIAGALAAFLAFNFFFTEPQGSLLVGNSHDLLALIVFLGLSMIISTLVSRSRARAREASRRHRQSETLYRLSIALISADDLNSVLTSIVEGVHRVLDLSSSAVLTAGDSGLSPTASAGEPLDYNSQELLNEAQRCLERGEPAGTVTRPARQSIRDEMPDISADHEVLLIPIATSAERIGVLVVARRQDQAPFDAEARRLVMTFANQAALAIERTLLTEQRTLAEVLSRADELKSALLSAVSHDLRTPLASIKASVTTLMQPGINLHDRGRRELLEAIDEEADRLNKLVANLLDLSRIEAGALKPALDWYEPSEILDQAMERCGPLVSARPIDIEMPEPPIWIRVDFVMILEVLINLLENAAKYSPAGTPIRVSGRAQADMLEISVADEGSGVPPGEEERIFDKFYRVESRHRTIGSGMGLAICRGFVQAHGGRIWAAHNDAGGSTFTFTVPLAAQTDPFSLPEMEKTTTS